MPFLRLVNSLLCIMLASTVSAQTIRVGGDSNYPPYEFINSAGEPDGYNTELTRAVAEVMGMDVQIELGPWNQMRKRLEAGDIDVVQGMVASEERSGRYAFAPPHALVHQSIFARLGSTKITDLEQLVGKEVIVQRGGVMHDYLAQHFVNAKLILVESHAQALRLLASGQHDYAAVANLPGLYLGKELSLSNIEPIGRPFNGKHYGYATLANNAELLAQFSEGLAILKNTGKQQQIYDKWLGPLNANQGIPWRQIGQVTAVICAILLLILAVIMVWNRMLTKEVNRRTLELKQQQRQLVQADKMASLGVLVSGVAHEINNPSSLLLLNLPVLQEFLDDVEPILDEYYQQHGNYYLAGLPYSQLREELPAMLQDMLAGSQKIRHIVDDLKDFAREAPDTTFELVDLNKVLALAIRLVDKTIRQSTDHFNVSYGANLPPLYGNGQRIEQVLINLIVNACQALEHTGQSISIRTYMPTSTTLACVIEDQGRGIEPAFLERLCDPFFTTRREEGGTGLGLSVSSRIIQEHQGQLTFTSTPGQGTQALLTFSVTQELSHAH
ncbi:transporter substrate-binding domain-containing protein [Marinomonas fungiae]|uniref:transporter substrate-binding domain-containing protein n=1 Tax=Marinomonas fungiae TaxID=1137284 RepID=UPI003A917ED0